MSYSLTCPQCNATLKYTSDFFGRAVNCPRCQLTIIVPDHNEPVQAELCDEYALAEEPAAPPTIAATPVRPKKKKKKPQPTSWLERIPPVSIDPTIIKAVLGVLFLAFLVWGAAYAMKQRPARGLPADKWVPFELAGRFKALFPGEPKVINQHVMGISFTYYQVQPNQDCIYGVGLTDGVLPAARMNLPSEQLLNDSCNGAMANIEKMGGTEVRRTSIKLGEYPGKELEVDVPQGKGQFVFRVYLAGQRLYIVMIGGKGLSADHPDVKKMMDSFEILEEK